MPQYETSALLQQCMRRMLLSRVRLLVTNGFYGMLLMHVELGLTEETEVAYTDGERICFNPEAMERMTNDDLDFVMQHEILHIVLQHCWRGAGLQPERYNIACDIVVNSSIFGSSGVNPRDLMRKLRGEPMHLAPGGREGRHYTAEEVYAMLPDSPSSESVSKTAGRFDDHSHFKNHSDGSSVGNAGASFIRDQWEQRLVDACVFAERCNTWANAPAFAKRMMDELRAPQIDWRTILSEFIDEEICDYSFSPPDRRFADSPFFLPDFNDTDMSVNDILFMIDTSGSMSSSQIAAVYSEVKGAIDQFGGGLRGWLGFFDAVVIGPVRFTDESELLAILPTGGGGTDFQVVFDYVRIHMQDRLPASIIILTDGWAKFPPAEAAMGIPVLWVINNKEINPPWGKVARIS